MLIEKKTQRGRRYYENAEGDIVQLQCTGDCGEVKDVEGFEKDKTGLDDRRSKCRECESERKRKYREENREKEAERSRKWREENRDNPEYKARKAELARKWWSDNRDRIRLIDRRRKARKASLPDTLTHDRQTDIFAHFDGCALAGDTDDIHMDHVIPLASGHGGTTYENMIPLRADLNISKGDRNLFDWFYANRERFGLKQKKFDALIEYLADINGMTTAEYEAYVRWCHDNPRTLDEIATQTDAN